MTGRTAIRRFLLAAFAAGVLAGCGGVMRVAYNNSDFALRLMANEYLDLQGEQQEQLKAQLARFHEWHRREELPLYAGIFQGAGERLGRGLTREDVTWAFGATRARYRVFMLQAADESAPVMASLKSSNYAALEKKFADGNTKFTKEYLGPDQAKRERARTKWLVERFEFFVGDLTDAQVALVERFVQSQPRINEVRLTDRKRRQQEFVELVRKYQSSPELAERFKATLVDLSLADVALKPELMQGDGIHPNAAGQKIVFANVWRVLGPMLASRDAP